jgi:hypothetical protein
MPYYSSQKIVTLLKNNMLLKSRILLGVFLIIYLSIFVIEYQESITLGDKIKQSYLLSHNLSANEYEDGYAIGIDELTTRDEVVSVLLQTLIVFIFPILILFRLKSRILVYSLTLLTYILPIIINPYMLYFMFLAFYLLPLQFFPGLKENIEFLIILDYVLFALTFAIPICLTLYWEYKRRNNDISI